MTELDPSIREARDQMAAAGGPILGRQRAELGADRFAHFTQGHAKLSAMTMFLILSVSTVPRADYSDEALAALRQDARDVREAADEWATFCEELADHWQAQRQESER